MLCPDHESEKLPCDSGPTISDMAANGNGRTSSEVVVSFSINQVPYHDVLSSYCFNVMSIPCREQPADLAFLGVYGF